MQNRKRDTDVTDFWTLWEKARVGCFERTASKHVYYLGWNRSPAQVGCMRQVLGAGALGRPRGIGWRGRWEGGSGWGTHVNPWLIHVNVWQNPLKYCKVISLQVIKNKWGGKKCLVSDWQRPGTSGSPNWFRGTYSISWGTEKYFGEVELLWEDKVLVWTQRCWWQVGFQN